MSSLKIFSTIFLFFVISILLISCDSKPTNNKRIGIVIPIEHKAINEIVAGFTETLKQQSSVPLTFKIANAQGDLNLQRSIIKQMQDEKYDLIVPIATGPTQMAAAMIHNQPIVSLAADFTEQQRRQLKICNIAIVHDNIPPQHLLNFIHLAYPHITHITLVHSASDKIFPDVALAASEAKKIGIEIKPVMVPTLTELYAISNSLPEDTQAILVLKDNLIVSGIASLEIVANKKSIPLITSDQGSVEDGAAFSLGVHERDIGAAGAKLAATVLSGTNACAQPIIEMDRLTLFVNKKSLTKEKQSFEILQNTAQILHYQVEVAHD